ncbi:MAG: hypothetical protein L6R39_005684 [Caloplaca ligustica]|nr:MAG: hypothetical protein L6R39_005684 [Caloplaca ligustica]
MGNEQSKQRFKDIAAQRKDAAGPVKVPRADREKRQRGPDTQFEPSGPPRDLDYVPPSNLNFPPRMPLPIGEEDHSPGSPIITPADISSVLNEDEVDGVLPRQGSVLSSTTAEDDDFASDGLQPYPLDGPKRTVPTTLQWKQGGDRVYVTGTFTSWSRKFRMHRDADDIPADKRSETSKTAEGVYPPQTLPEGTEARDHAPDSLGKHQPLEDEQPAKPVYWGNGVPEYLFDLDQPEQGNRYRRGNKSAADFATPPNIPVFLQKLILNGTTPMKDDNSVLNMPNHTVLNHLATSSIKNHVLATSVTTRYKRKYVTTMMYKPTDDDGE